MKLIIDVFGSVLEVLVLYYFFDRVLSNNRSSKTVKLIAGSVSIFLFTLISTLSFISDYVPIISFIVLILYASLLYKDKFIKKVLFSLMIFVFGILSEASVGILLTFILKININDVVANMNFYLLGIILSKLVLYFIFRIIGLFEFNKRIEINFKSVVAVLIIPLSSIVSIYYFAMIAYKTENALSSTVLLVVTALTITSNISTFYLLERQIKLKNTEDILINLEKQYKLQADYYTELKQNMIMSNKNVHDVKNFIAAISSYIDNQKTDIAKSKIEEFYGQIPGIKKIETGNDAVNALVQSKLRIITDEIPNNIISVIIPKDLKIDEIDLCILIGNALDNAVEACKKLANKNDRMLELKIFPVNSQISMLFVNAKEKSSAKTAGIFKTTKSDSFMHGFGIENMKNICRKYDGSISFAQTEDRFSVSILLPN